VDKDPFFDDSMPDPGPPSEDLWVIQKDLPAEISAAENARHEWELTAREPGDGETSRSAIPIEWASLARYQYRCRRCGLTIACPPWEDPFEDDGTEALQDQTCTELMLSNTHED